MSHRSKPARRRADPSSSYHAPASWSEWTWSDDYNMWARWRYSNAEHAVAGMEWDYKPAVDPVAAEPRTTETYGQSTRNAIPEITGDEGEYTTDPAPALATQHVTPTYQSTAARSPGVESITRGMGAMNTGYSSSHIRGDTSRNRTHERFDKSYKIHKEYEFKQFRVFKVVWSEPQGGNGEGSQGSHDTISVRDTRNGPAHEKVRRFVIISPMKGHCLCLPINTYLKQGVMKSGVHAEHHTIIHTSKKPEYLSGEWEKGMTRTPIKIDPTTPRDKLEPQSRLNYAKVYTVEYNVKVCFIGRVHVDYRSQVVFDYNAQHPQLSYGGNSQAPAFSTQDVTQTGGWAAGYDGGGDGGYQESANPVDSYPDQVNEENKTYTETYIVPAADLSYTQEYPDRHTDAILEEGMEDTISPAYDMPQETYFAGADIAAAEPSYHQQQPHEGETVDLYSSI